MLQRCQQRPLVLLLVLRGRLLRVLLEALLPRQHHLGQLGFLVRGQNLVQLRLHPGPLDGQFCHGLLLLGRKLADLAFIKIVAHRELTNLALRRRHLLEQRRERGFFLAHDAFHLSVLIIAQVEAASGKSHRPAEPVPVEMHGLNRGRICLRLRECGTGHHRGGENGD